MTVSRDHLLVLLGMAFGCLVGCNSLPEDAFRLSETSLETRQLQTRQYEEVAEGQILSASVGLLQDLGYTLDELDKDLGVISASKKASATNEAQVVGGVAVDVLGCLVTYLLKCNNKSYKKTDKVQDIRLTLVVLPILEKESTLFVRVTMQRIVWDRANRISKQATIIDTEVYQEFFSKLDKSLFLEKEGT